MAVNAYFLTVMGGDRSAWLQQTMDGFTPLASRIFLQTHVWPMLMQDGQVKEVRFQIQNADKLTLPALVNCQRSTDHAVDAYHWVFFITHERAHYEAELLEARKRANALAVRFETEERFLRTITDAVPSLISYWDKDLRCRFANKTYVSWFGKSTVEMLGMPIQEVMGTVLYNLNLPHIQGALAGKHQEFERNITKADGNIVCALANYVSDIDATGAVIGFSAVVTNVTRIKEADDAIRLSASVFKATSEGIMVTRVTGDIVSVNPAFCRITGYAEAEVLGRNPRMLQSGQHSKEFFAALWASLLRAGEWHGELWCKRKDGTLYLEDLSITSIHDGSGKVVRYVGVFSDITERHHREEQIKHMALHDGLTKLPNRVLLMERLNQLVESANRDPRPLAVLYLDLDGFKAVNDQFGHESGDMVLKAVAKRLQELVRTSDTVARLGGDEFVILLHNPDGTDALANIAERVILSISAPIACIDGVATVSTSIGIAIHPGPGSSPDLLLMQADQAMYRAKRSGKNTYRFSE